MCTCIERQPSPRCSRCPCNPRCATCQRPVLTLRRGSPNGLDDAQTLAERQARARGTEIERNLFPDEIDDIPILDEKGENIAKGRSSADLRWPRFVVLPAWDMQAEACLNAAKKLSRNPMMNTKPPVLPPDFRWVLDKLKPGA